MKILETAGTIAAILLSNTGNPEKVDDYGSASLHAGSSIGSTAVTHSAIVERRVAELRRLLGFNYLTLGTNYTPRTLLGMVLDYRYLDPEHRREFGMLLLQRGAKFCDFTEEDWKYASLWGLTIEEDLSSFDLHEKDLCEADLSGANLTADQLSGCFVSSGTRLPFDLREVDVHDCETFWIDGRQVPMSPREFLVWTLRKSDRLHADALQKMLRFSPNLKSLALQAYHRDAHKDLLPRLIAVALSEGQAYFVSDFVPHLNHAWSSRSEREKLQLLLHEQLGLLLGGRHFNDIEESIAQLYDWDQELTEEQDEFLYESTDLRKRLWLDVGRITFGFRNLAIDAKSASGSSLLEAYGLAKSFHWGRVTFTTVEGTVPDALLDFNARAEGASKWLQTPTIPTVRVSLQPGRILVTDLDPAGCGTLLLANSSFERREFAKPAYWSPEVVTVGSSEFGSEEDLESLGFIHLFSKDLNIDPDRFLKFEQLLTSVRAVIQGYRMWLCDTSPNAVRPDGTVIGLVFSDGMREAVARLPELLLSGRVVKARFEAWKGIPWQNITYTLSESDDQGGEVVTLQELVITPEILTILRCLVEDDSEALRRCSMPLITQVQRFYNAGLQGFGSFNLFFA